MKKLLIFAIAAVGLLACTGQNNPNNPETKTGVLPGEFSVAVGRKVQFSQGNLQYQASTNTWRFAENQYDTIGVANLNISETYDGWIDLFGWGTGNHPALTSNQYEDYEIFTDWGINKIINGGNDTHLWRTLTGEEWIYLLDGRPGAARLFAFGVVNGVKGLIILPDNFTLPSNLSFVASSTSSGTTYYAEYVMYYNENDDNYSHNTYSANDWTKMEKAGAVFLPAAGARSSGRYFDSCGFYWFSTPFEQSQDKYFHMSFASYEFRLLSNWAPYSGQSVRLVRKN